MKKSDAAYIAGLFDGEGDVGNYRYRATKNGRYYPKLTARIHNTNREALDWVYKKVGVGKVYKDRQGIKKSGNHARKQGYVFIVTHRQARKFLPIIFPFLIIKRDRVLEILSEDSIYRNRNVAG